ncbi:MAG TPA: phosphotransferase, partial [Anaeromyxobacteraceae bacterium]|nr:phosphotransferase [Anaeromyxobacteraceae bacterium]
HGTPDHVRAVAVGAIAEDGRCVSLREPGEFYLVTEWAEGVPYAEDLRRVARAGVAGPLDRARAEALARWLASLHAERWDDVDRWHRAVRDLLGHGEGIFGMVDGYPPDTPAAPPARLRAIEERCLAWRWRLRDLRRRLARTHGDFHPFNVLFPPAGAGDAVRFRLLDASRGGAGDPADDLTAMALNYVFFAVEHRAAWARGLGPLWRTFLETYLEAASDEEVHETAPPFLAWRGLVVASPRFYPNLSAEARDALLAFVERVLDRGFLDVAAADEVLGRSEP